MNGLKHRSVALWSLMACVLGGGGSFLLLNGLPSLSFASFSPSLVYEAPAQPSSPFQRVALGAIALSNTTIPSEGKAIGVDLTGMTVTLYEGGNPKESFPILSKGKPGTPWETPAGTYQIETKEENHFSSIGRVWMPSSMQFFGNFFIHGWPSYPSGEPVPKGYSGGCVRLSTADAQKVFAFASVGTPVIVTDVKNRIASSARDQNFYFVTSAAKPPTLTAQSYLVADLDTGEILLQRDASRVHPIASISKLITALTSLEVLNQYQPSRVSARAVATHGDFGGLQTGEIVTPGTLIYPLLLESSNDAAEMLAEIGGGTRFITAMNVKARSIGLSKTNFADASGLSEGNVSTANDLFTLLQYLFHHKPFVLDTTRLALKRMEPEIPGSVSHTWYNNNYFVRAGNPRYLGGKNGYTDEAGRTLVSLFTLPLSEFQKRNIAVIVLGSDNREKDAEAALAYITKNIYYGASTDAARLASRRADGGAPAVLSPAGVAVVDKLVASLGSLTEQEKSGEGSVSLLFTGDIQMDRGVRTQVEKNFGGNYNSFFSTAPGIKRADIAVGNLEGPISDVGSNHGSIYSFRMDPLVAPALATAGFDVVNVANNHAGDWGKEAFIDTLARLTRAHIAYTGGGMTRSEAEKPTIVSRGGTKIGFLGFSDVGPAWLAVGGSTPGILLASDPRRQTIIAEAKKQVDVLVVSFHFGDEYEKTQNERQRVLAHAAIEAGADMVVGHHPHVVEGTELYNGGLIAYSLGNFVFDQSFSPDTMEGLALSVGLTDGAITTIEKHQVTLNAHFQPQLAR